MIFFLCIVHQNWFARLKMIKQNVSTFVYTTLVNLNIFSLQDLGSNVDRITAKRYGIWATRLYIVSLTIGITILVLYTVVQSQTQTKIFDKPTFSYYNHLRQLYGDELKCSCSLIALTHDRFVKIEAVFHEVRKNIMLTHFRE